MVRTVAACVCGSDLWPCRSMPATDTGRPMGHEFLGVVEETGTDVRGLKAGDLVVAPFTYSGNTCDYCAKGLHISCRGGGRYGFDGVDGGQGEDVRVPYADGTLVKLPVAADSALLPSLLALSDAMTTGHHGAVTAGVGRGDAVLVVGDGAVGEQLLPDVLDGTITPGRVFDRTFTLDQTPDAYRAMADRQVLKALITP